MIETDRLKIHVASREEMEGFIANHAAPEFRKAYGEMLQGALDHQDAWEWYAIWMIELKDGRENTIPQHAGVDFDGSVEIGFGICSGYRGNGYATEAVTAVVVWALQQSGVVRVEAETAPNNFSSQHVLASCGFVSAGIIGVEGPRFVRTR